MLFLLFYSSLESSTYTNLQQLMFFLILAAILEICKLDGKGAISQLANIGFWIQHTRIPLKMISNPFPHKMPVPS